MHQWQLSSTIDYPSIKSKVLYTTIKWWIDQLNRGLTNPGLSFIAVVAFGPQDLH